MGELELENVQKWVWLLSLRSMAVPLPNSLSACYSPGERLIVECFTNNGVAGVKFREDEEEGWTPVSRRRSRRWKMGPGRTSGDPVDPVTIPDEATVFFHLVAGTPLLSM